MKRRLYAPTVLLVGLLSAQIVATAHVYLSNLDLLQASEAIMRSGYLSVPNAQVVGQLGALTTAMAGGLLFTLSLGAGLSLATLVAVWLWDRMFQRKRKAMAGGLLIWVAALVFVNDNGWNLMASAYITAVPLVTAITAVWLLPARTTLLSPTGVIWPLAAVLVLAMLWALVWDRNLFTNVRDHLLLGNRVGQSITNAYYAYTLFPAEAFKSLEQKQLRTCVLGASLNRSSRNRIEQTLRSHDYLPLPTGNPADVTVEQDIAEDGVKLEDDHRLVLSVPAQELFGSTADVLSAYSQALDRNQTFRTLTLVCLLLGLPLVLFAFLFSVLGAVPNLFFTIAASDGIAAALCVAAGIILLVPVYQGRNASAAIDGDISALSAPSVAIRIAALRQACADQRDIFPVALQYALHTSSHMAERYWLARSLAYTSDPQALALLPKLIDDPAPIVACQALWAMGERRDKAWITTIIARINASPQWYIQMYGYRALRTLGWVQHRSPQFSY